MRMWWLLAVIGAIGLGLLGCGMGRRARHRLAELDEER